MKIRQLLLVLGLLVFSPFVLADEMGTGNPDTTTSEPKPSADSDNTKTTTSKNDYCSLWETIFAWFEQE